MRAPAGIPTSPWPTCAPARAAWPTPRPCSSARTSRCRRCCPRPASTWPAATSSWPAPRPGAGLRAVGDDRLRAVELLAVLVDAELAAGDRTRPPRPAASWLAARATARPPRPPGPPRGGTGPGPGRRRRRGGRHRRAGGGRRRPRPPPAPVAAGRLLLELARLRERAGDRGRRACSTPRRPPPSWPSLDVVPSPAEPRSCSAWLGAPRRPSRRSGAATLAAKASGGWPSCDGRRVRLPDTQGPPLPGRAGRHPGRAPCARPGRPGRGGAAARQPSTAGRWATPARCSTARPGPPTAAESRSCGPRSTTPWRRAGWRRRRPPRTELDQLVRRAGPGLRPRRSGPAGGVGRRAGPPQRHPGAPGGHRPSSWRRCRSRAAPSTGGCAPASTAPTNPRPTTTVRWIVQSGLNETGADLNANGAWKRCKPLSTRSPTASTGSRPSSPT